MSRFNLISRLAKWQRNFDASNTNDLSKRELLDCYINCLCSFSMLELSLDRVLFWIGVSIRAEVCFMLRSARNPKRFAVCSMLVSSFLSFVALEIFHSTTGLYLKGLIAVCAVARNAPWQFASLLLLRSVLHF